MIALHHWRMKHKISYAQVSRWCKKYSAFNDIYTECKEIIGERRDELAAWKKLDSAMVKYTLPNYNRSARELEEWRAELKAKAAENTETTTRFKIVEVPVEIPAFTSSIPHKKETIGNS